MYIKMQDATNFVLLDTSSDCYALCKGGRIIERGQGVGRFALGSMDRVVVSFISSGNIIEMYVDGEKGIKLTYDLSRDEMDKLVSRWREQGLVGNIVMYPGEERGVRYNQMIYVMKGDKVFNDLGLRE